MSLKSKTTLKKGLIILFHERNVVGLKDVVHCKSVNED